MSLNSLSKQYLIDKRLRRIIFILAIVATALNWRVMYLKYGNGLVIRRVLWQLSWNDKLIRICADEVFLVFDVVLNILLYYIAGGIAGTIEFLKLPTSIFGIFGSLMAALCPFFIPFVTLIVWFASFGLAVAVAYLLPFIGVPLAGALRAQLIKDAEKAEDYGEEEW